MDLFSILQKYYIYITFTIFKYKILQFSAIYDTIYTSKNGYKGGIGLGTYQIPRNVKGESRILFIFSTKALIYTAVTGGVGLLFYFIINSLGFFWVGAGIRNFFRTYRISSWNI